MKARCSFAFDESFALCGVGMFHFCLQPSKHMQFWVICHLIAYRMWMLHFLIIRCPGNELVTCLRRSPPSCNKSWVLLPPCQWLICTHQLDGLSISVEQINMLTMTQNIHVGTSICGMERWPLIRVIWVKQREPMKTDCIDYVNLTIYDIEVCFVFPPLQRLRPILHPEAKGGITPHDDISALTLSVQSPQRPCRFVDERSAIFITMTVTKSKYRCEKKSMLMVKCTSCPFA